MINFRSEFGQERIALELLNGRRDGTFVDIGATDGVTRNNTYTLETEFGWRGVCIEPVLTSFNILRGNRTCAALHACVGDYSQVGLVKFHEDRGNHEISRIDAHGNAWVPCLTLNQVLDGLGIMSVDFLSIDTEGNEFNILRAIDFNRHPIRVIDFEHNEQWGPIQRQNKAAIHELLCLNGYQKHVDVGVDSIYAKL